MSDVKVESDITGHIVSATIGRNTRATLSLARTGKAYVASNPILLIDIEFRATGRAGGSSFTAGGAAGTFGGGEGRGALLCALRVSRCICS